MNTSKDPKMQELIQSIERSGFSVHDILNSMGYYGFKLWTQEDMEAQFTDIMKEDDSVSGDLRQLWGDKTAAEVGLNIQACDSGLSTCTDDDWDTILNCIFSKIREAEASIRNAQGR